MVARVLIGHLLGGCSVAATRFLLIGRVLLRNCYAVLDSCQGIAKWLLGYSE